MSRGRRAALVLSAFVALFVVVAVFGKRVGSPLRSLVLPLSYVQAIRTAAQSNGIEPALLAAVIYVETRFRPRASSAGAVGPMQVEPSTAAAIARRARLPDPSPAALAAPSLNIAFGARYLAYLLHRFGGDLEAALAAYNAGEGPVERWLVRARQAHSPFGLAWIGYPQTRVYVESILSARQAYRDTYADRLGSP